MTCLIFIRLGERIKKNSHSYKTRQFQMFNRIFSWWEERQTFMLINTFNSICQLSSGNNVAELYITCRYVSKKR